MHRLHLFCLLTRRSLYYKRDTTKNVWTRTTTDDKLESIRPLVSKGQNASVNLQSTGMGIEWRSLGVEFANSRMEVSHRRLFPQAWRQH